MAGQRFKFYCIPDSSDSNTVVSGIVFLKYGRNSSARVRQKEIYSVYEGIPTVLIANYSVTPLSDSHGVELGHTDAIVANFAGTYTCDYRNDSGYWACAAELVVLDSDPECSAEYDAETDTSLLHCAVNFSGNYYPRMEWRSSNGTLLRACDERTVLHTDGQQRQQLILRCDVTVTGDSEGQGAQCRTFFTSDGLRNEVYILQATYSRHVPSYNYTCTPAMHLGFAGAWPDKSCSQCEDACVVSGESSQSWLIVYVVVAAVVGATCGAAAATALIMHRMKRSTSVSVSTYSGLDRPVGLTQPHHPAAVYEALTTYEEIRLVPGPHMEISLHSGPAPPIVGSGSGPGELRAAGDHDYINHNIYGPRRTVGVQVSIQPMPIYLPIIN